MRCLLGWRSVATAFAGAAAFLAPLTALPARFLTALWPVVKRWAGRHLGIGPETAREDEASSWRAFDVIAERLADGRPYLCGDRFTAADVTFAALSAALTVPSLL